MGVVGAHGRIALEEGCFKWNSKKKISESICL